jgi:hypothetical protein
MLYQNLLWRGQNGQISNIFLVTGYQFGAKIFLWTDSGSFRLFHSIWIYQIVYALTFKLTSKMGRHKNIAKGQFCKGHEGYGRNTYPMDDHDEPVSIRRMSNDVFSMVSKSSPSGLLYAPDAEGQPGPSKLLRPIHGGPISDLSEQYLEDGEKNIDNSEMRLISTHKYAEMWNTAIREHKSTACNEGQFTVHKELKKGLGWKQSLKCINCVYTSDMFKLYNEVFGTGRGAKRAKCNVGLQIGLQDSPIGNTRARMLVASTNTPPPARSAMQRLSNSVGMATKMLNLNDIRERMQNCKRINKLRGLPADSPINVSMDVRYNSTTIASRHKMGQNASQAIGIVTETQTDRKQIVGVHLVNKLCYVGSWLRNRGFNVQCPGHADCTATMTEMEPMSEKIIGAKIGADLVEEGLLVRYVTTDGDARGAEGIQNAMLKSDPGWRTERQADTTHLGQAQFRHTVRATFSEGMFPGQTAERRKEQQKMLGLDIKNRCHRIITELHKAHTGNISIIAKKMPTIIEVTLDCYSGNCKKCLRNGIVCRGGVRKSWWNSSLYLSRCGLTQLNVSDGDRQLLKALLLLRLGVESLRLTRLNTNTNKNEAVNRGLSVSLPKNVNFGRNAEARTHPTIHRLNLGAGNSLLQKLETVGSPACKGGRVAKAIRHMQITSRYHTEYLKRSFTRRRKLQNKLRHIRDYLTAKYQRRIKPDYKKGQLDPMLNPKVHQHRGDNTTGHKYHLRQRAGRKTRHDEHPYFKPLHHI